MSDEQKEGICRQIRHVPDPPEAPPPLPPLSREEILAADDLPCEQVRIEGWGGTVRIRTLSGTERDGFEHLVQLARRGSNRVDLRGLKVKLLILTVCGEDRKPLFAETDAPALNAKSSRVIEELFQQAMILNGMTKEAVDEMAGNSDSDRNDSSG